jgi:hypothetical protein
MSTKGYEGYNQHLWAAEGPEVHGSCSTQLRFEEGMFFQPRPNSIGLGALELQRLPTIRPTRSHGGFEFTDPSGFA